MKIASGSGYAAAALKRYQLAAPLQSIIALLHSPLTRNGYALVMSAGITSGLGLLFWVIAARLYPADQVGLGAAMLAALLTLGNIAQLNLDTVLNRFLPVAGTRTRQMIAWSYAASVVTALVISLVFVLATAFLAPRLTFLADDKWLAFSFMVSCAVWALFALQDAVLAGLRKSTWIPLENTAYSIAKIGALIALAAIVTVRAPIFFAWVVPLPLIVAIVTIGIFRYLVPLNASRGDSGGALNRKSLIRFFGWDYAGSITMMLAMGGAPLLVLNLTGPESMADYHIAWTITSSLYLIGRSMGMSLLAEGAADEGRIKSLTADALVHTFLLLSAALVLVIAGADIIMSLFGPRYAENGVSLLRVLALSCLPWSLITIYLSVARANGHLIMVASVQFATMVLVLGLGAPLLYQFGTLGMGVAWLVTHTVVLAGIGFHIVKTGGPGSLLDWLLAIASSLSRLAATFLHRPHKETSGVVKPDELDSVLRQIGGDGTGSWAVLEVAPTQSDVQTVYIGPVDESAAPSDGLSAKTRACILMKTAASAAGAAALDQHARHVERLRADERVARSSILLPEILHYNPRGKSSWLLERKLPGEDGHTMLRTHERQPEAFKAANRSIISLHNATAKQKRIDGEWLHRWIDQPAETMNRPVLTLMTASQRIDAIEQFVADQHRFWQNEVLPVGVGHGDYSPGNVLFSTPQRVAGAKPSLKGNITVSGILDWGTATEDAPPGFDTLHFTLTTRMLLTGQELGQVICNFLLDPSFTAEETENLSLALGAYPETMPWLKQPDALRALVGLAWLHHVKSNIEKSPSYSLNRLWTAWNVERVLQTMQRTNVLAMA